MLTTPRSSERRAACAAASCAALWLLAGCGAPRAAPDELFQLSSESPAERSHQTRFFDTPSESELLSASAAVLQDLGFQLTESEREVGFLRASKERSAREWGQDITRFVIFVLSQGSLLPVDLHQQINASLVTRPLADDPPRQQVRVLFYRVVWLGDGQMRHQNHTEYIPPGQQRMEMIRDPEIYQQFFARLAKAVFLEAHRI